MNRDFAGTPRVLKVIPLANPEPVFNLEVQCDHVYHVAKNGVLVHNGGEDCLITLFKAPRATYQPARIVTEGFNNATFSGGAFFTTSANVAGDYARAFQNGVLECRMLRSEFDDLVRQGKIVVDSNAPNSFRVVGDALEEFNSLTTRRWIDQASEEFWRLFGYP